MVPRSVFYYIEKAEVWCGPVNDYEDLVADPQLAENRMLVEIDHSTVGTYRTTGLPVKLGSTPGDIRTAPPLLGEHTIEILQQLGYTEPEVESLKTKGIIRF